MRLIILLLMSSFVLASDLGIGRTMEQMVQSSSFRFMLVFMLFFLLLYAIFLATIAKVSVFKGKGSLPSKQGKVVALSLGLMGAFGVSYWANYSSAEFVTRVLSVAGWFGAIAFAFLAAAVAWKSKFGNWGYPALVAGMAFLTFGILIGEEWAIRLGNLLIVVGIFGLIFWIFGDQGGSGSGSSNGSDGRGGAGNNPAQGGNGGNGGGNPNQGGNGGNNQPPPDFSGQLQQLQNLLNQFQQQFNTFRTQGDQMCQKNYHHLNPPGSGANPNPPVTDADWQYLFQLRNSCNTTAANINNIINSITGDAQFPNMTNQQWNQFQQDIQTWLNHISSFSNYEQNFINRFQNGLP
ncbi:MAG: hypothetical protein ACLFP2_05305 [Candidatus Woesearchaeota archaeon]